MPARSAFDYALVRVVPHVEREEFINVGVILFCRPKRFLDARIALDEDRLAEFAPHLDVDEVKAHLALIPRICAGGPEAGPFSEFDQSQRFHWLTSPKSTIVQVSPVHCGICEDPQATLEKLFKDAIG